MGKQLMLMFKRNILYPVSPILTLNRICKLQNTKSGQFKYITIKKGIKYFGWSGHCVGLLGLKVILSLSRQMENIQGARGKLAAVLELFIPRANKLALHTYVKNSSSFEKWKKSSCPLSNHFLVAIIWIVGLGST